METGVPVPPPEEENLYRTQREKRTLRRIVGAKDEPAVGKRAAGHELTNIGERMTGLVERSGGLSAAKEQYRRDKATAEEEVAEERTGIDEEAILDDLGERAETYTMIHDLAGHKLDELTKTLTSFSKRRMNVQKRKFLTRYLPKKKKRRSRSGVNRMAKIQHFVLKRNTQGRWACLPKHFGSIVQSSHRLKIYEIHKTMKVWLMSYAIL
jgi:hypothetical protein